MKFGKEYWSQMVPEWQEAYLDYNKLKAILVEVNQSKKPTVSDASGHLRRRGSLYRAFSGLTGQVSSPRKQDGSLVTSIEQDESYRSMLFMSSDQESSSEVAFFKSLDDEFNKVVRFYKKEVGGLMVEAEELSKQMNIFIALKVKVERPDDLPDNSDKPVDLTGEDEPSNVNTTSTLNSFNASTFNSFNASTFNSFNARPPDGRSEERSQLNIIQEDERPDAADSVDKVMKAKESRSYSRKGNRVANQPTQVPKPAPLDLLPHVRINLTPETPVSTIKYMVANTKAPLSYNKTELKQSEELMVRAFIQFYHKLQVLKGYSYLNILAISKILKKYDKITSRKVSKVYLEMVDRSPLGCVTELTRLLGRVETVFVKHFANGNRRIGMDVLRRKSIRGRTGVTFFSGFFVGCAFSLIVIIVVIVHLKEIFQSKGRNQYMNNIFPLYSLYGYIVVHMLMYSGNLYFWRRYRINYTFMFGFKPGTELCHREVFFLASGLAVLTLACVLSHLDMEIDPKTKSFAVMTESIPLALLTVVLLILFCPFNIIFRSSRLSLLRSVLRMICAPFYKVTLQDFYLADQFTSQVQALRSVEFYICYYGWGDFIRRSNQCKESRTFEFFYFVVAIIPYWIRFLQCVRRFIEEKDEMHVYNGLKYLSTFFAVVMRTCNDLYKKRIWRVLAALSSTLATVYGTYWDIVCDWGLLRDNSKNPYLRDKLIVANHSVYFIAVGVNIVLRLAWMQSVIGFKETSFIHRQALTAFVAVLEIIRRGIWNFFRLENEHLNNVGKYRAFNSVPLPFEYDEDDK